MITEELKNYSVGSVRTILDDYMIEFQKNKYSQMLKDKSLIKYQFMVAEEAIKQMCNLVSLGYKENEAWELVSTELIYIK